MKLSTIFDNVPAPKPDLVVTNCGSAVLINLLTPAAREWTTEHVNVPDWAWMGLGFAVEPRMVEAILEGAEGAGLEVRT